MNNALENYKLYRLLKQVTEGDERAFDTLFRDYGKFIYCYILRITADRDVAEEIFQEVFITLLTLPPDRLPAFGAVRWLVRVVHNTAVSYLTRREMRLSGHAALDDAPENQLTAWNGPDTEDAVLSRLYAGELLSLLRPDTQQILLLRCQGYSFREIADRLHMKPAAVRSRYSRSLAKLRTVWERDNGEQ